MAAPTPPRISTSLTDTTDMLNAGQLRGIPKLDRAELAKETSQAEAGRILRDLTAFRLAVMEAVKPAAVWLIEG